MLLAGNGTKKQPEISIPSKKDGFIISKSYASPLPSPLPMTSHANSQQRGGSSSNNEITILRSLGPSSVPNNHLESSIVATSIGSAPKEMIQSGTFYLYDLLMFVILCWSDLLTERSEQRIIYLKRVCCYHFSNFFKAR